jgi:hypothetical protein
LDTERTSFLKGLTLAAVAIGIVIFWNAQPAISIPADSNARTFLAGEITVSVDLASVANKAFTFTLVHPLKAGDVIAAMTSDDQAWSIDKIPLLIGTNKVQYPILASIKSSDGNFHTVLPGVLKSKVSINAGVAVHFGGYQIDVDRPVKAGESISSLLVAFAGGYSFLSVEAAARG